MNSPDASKAYPLRVEAELAPQISRALWLVKCTLGIPASRSRTRIEAVAAAGFGGSGRPSLIQFSQAR